MTQMMMIGRTTNALQLCYKTAPMRQNDETMC